MNVALWQLVLAVSIPTIVAMIGVLFGIITSNKLGDKIDRQGETLNTKIDRQGEFLNVKIERHYEILSAKIDRQGETLNAKIDKVVDKIDRQTENFNNQVTILLNTIHDVHVRVVKLEERDK